MAVKQTNKKRFTILKFLIMALNFEVLSSVIILILKNIYIFCLHLQIGINLAPFSSDREIAPKFVLNLLEERSFKYCFYKIQYNQQNNEVILLFRFFGWHVLGFMPRAF